MVLAAATAVNRHFCQVTIYILDVLKLHREVK